MSVKDVPHPCSPRGAYEDVVDVFVERNRETGLISPKCRKGVNGTLDFRNIRKLTPFRHEPNGLISPFLLFGEFFIKSPSRVLVKAF
jgi:hypothetical protein